MAPRNRPQRSRNPLLVAAAAVSRATDPKQPSRIVVIRLLGDALHALQESQIQVDEIRTRALAYTSRSTTAAAAIATRAQLESDNHLKAAHEHGARVLFSTTLHALTKLPCRAGPLRRRAIDLIRLAGRAAGPAIVMQGAETLRAHISSLKRLSWTDTEVGDFDVVCAILALADVSSCTIAGREVARESVQFLLSQRVRQKCKRGDLCYAIAQIVQSFPPHAPPDDRLIDSMLECCLSSPVVKQGSAGQGSALLTALIVPHMVSRGPLPSDDIVTACARAMRAAPTSPEKAMWALAVARASLTARRSTTYQVRKFGTTDGSKFPAKRPPVTGAQRFQTDPSDTDVNVWVSDQIFEQTMLQVAKVTGVFDGRVDSTVAIAAVCSMWSNTLPDSIPVIVPRTFDILLPHVTSVPAASVLLDGLWLGLLKNLKPSLSALVFESVLPALEASEFSYAVALHVCSALLAKFGRECLRESGLSVEYNEITLRLMSITHEALQTNFTTVRLAGVRLMLSIIHALPRTCSQFLTAILQNLRIADLALATIPVPIGGLSSFEDLSSIGTELSAILGNAAALSVLIAQVSSGQRRVPAALVRQCTIDSTALLRPHHANQKEDGHGPIVSCIRRRAGWGLVAALATAKRKDLFEEDTLSELISLWKEELGYAAQRTSKGGSPGGHGSVVNAATLEGAGDQTQIGFDESLAQASTRSSALHALVCSLRNFPSAQLEKCAKALIGACAARILALQTSLNGASQLGSLGSPSVLGGDSPKAEPMQGSNGKKRNSSLARLLVSEAMQLLQCVSIVPPTGAPAELCYYIAMHLGEEAQHALGEVDSNQVLTSSLPYNSSLPERSLAWESAMTNHRLSLNRLCECVSDVGASIVEKLSSVNIGAKRDAEKEQKDITGEVDRSWIFSTEGAEIPVAENSLVCSAQAIAAVVAQDLVTSGSLIESLSNAKCSSPLSAAIALELARRLSRSDLAEINRTLAMLQVLVRLSLGVPDGCLKALSVQSKSGRLYPPNPFGDGISLVYGEVPGAVLIKMATPKKWFPWARKLSDEGYLDNTLIHNFHSRSLGIMYATRIVAAEAHRELSKTGGPILWMGLTRKVISIVKENIDSSTPSQSLTAANAIASLGALLEAIPESGEELLGVSGDAQNGLDESSSIELDELFDEIIDILADAIEKDKASVRTAAALALSNCSPRLAMRSDKLLVALVRAWAQDKGDFDPLGHFGRLTTETSVWASCFTNVWKDIGIRTIGERKPFFCQDSCGIGSGSPALAIGAAAVLSSCRLQWWELNDSAAFSATELLTEMIQWTGVSAQSARAAGLYGISTLWASKIDLARANALSEGGVPLTVPAGSNFPTAADQYKDGVVPIQSFSLKESIRMQSAVGPFLDEVIYDSLAPVETEMVFSELQVAAIAAILELLRGAGIAEACTHLSKLPEVLFAAADKGIAEASSLLHILLQYDAPLRPRYWFGLCRAVCLGGDRLNHGSAKAVWDVSLTTKTLALKVAVEAVDRSVESCSSFFSYERTSNEDQVVHESAMNFLSKIGDFIHHLFQPEIYGVETSGEACKFFERISARIGSPGTNWKSNDKVMDSFTNLWSPSARNISKLLSDDVPHSVANMATMAMTEMLMASLRLGTAPLLEQLEDILLSFLSKGTAGSLRKRFLYSDQGEEVGLHATLALVSNYGRIISALLASSESELHSEQPQSTLWANSREKVETIKGLLFAVCGDFISTLRVNGLSQTAKYGGSLTAAAVPDSQLEAAISMYITPIILGAISCIGFARSCAASAESNGWLNNISAGTRVAEHCDQYESVVLASYVWLMKHEHEYSSSQFRKQSFTIQNQEALTYMLNSGKELSPHIKEVLTAFAQCKKSEFLSFSHRFSSSRNFDLTIGLCIMELVLSILMVSAVDNFKSVQENMGSVVTGLKALANIVERLFESRNELLKPYLSHCMDAVFLVLEQKGSRIVSMADDQSFREQVCDLMRVAVLSTEADEEFCKLCLSKTQRIFYDAALEQCPSIVKLCISIGATLGLHASETCSKPFADMLVARKVGTEDGVEDVAALSFCLSCPSVEDYVITTICEMSIDVGEDRHNAAKLVAYELAQIGVSKYGGKSASIALKCAIAAISDDGENCVVTNRVGLVLYSIFLPVVVAKLPDVDASQSISFGALDENGKYIAQLAREEILLLGSFAASLQKDERLKVERFLVALDNARQSA